MEHSYWGPAYGEEAVRRGDRRGDPRLRRPGRRLGRRRSASRPSGDEERLADARPPRRSPRGDVVGWYQGRSEWGPRALGNRSILADPRRADMKDVLNLKIKRRESFRPFAPSVLEERTASGSRSTIPIRS